MKIGLLGGTFDPVHMGHLMVAETAMGSLGLSEVIMVPAGRPLLKSVRPITPAGHRLEMLRLAIAGRPRFRVSTVEIERPGPSYTVDTVAELRGQLRGDDDLFFIMGWDSLAQLPGWREPSRLIKMCYLVVAPRPGFPRPDLEAMEAALPGISPRVVFLEGPLADISASAVRELAARGLPFGHLVPGPVAAYIKRHNLYSDS